MSYEKLQSLSKKYWFDGAGYQLTPIETIQNLDCSMDDVEFLQSVRLPEFAAPNLWFHFVDGDIQSYDSKLNSQKVMIKVGEDRDDRPIVFLPEHRQISVYSVKNKKYHFVAKSFVDLFQCLTSYAELVECLLEFESSFADIKSVDDKYINWFKQKISDVDVSLIQKDTFWMYEMRRLQGALKFYDD